MTPLTAHRAILMNSGEPFRLESVALPEPTDGALIVEIELCTICGSDLHTIEGRRPLAGPSVLGHEIIGRVAQLSGEVTTDVLGKPLELGDRITWSSHACCSDCFWCDNELTPKCDALFKYGHEPVSESYPCTGGFASHCQLRFGTSVIRIPEGMDGKVACPANCATSTVAAAFRHAGKCGGKAMLILGAGMLGLTATAWAREAGAESIVVVDPNPSRADLAVRFGATAIAHDLASAQVEVNAVTNDRGADVAFDFTGKNEAVLAAVHFLRIGGCAVLVGSVFPTESIALSPEMIVRRCLSVRGVHNYLAEDLVAAMSFLERTNERYPFASLVSDIYPLEQIERAVQHASSGLAIRVGVSSPAGVSS